MPIHSLFFILCIGIPMETYYYLPGVPKANYAADSEIQANALWTVRKKPRMKKSSLETKTQNPSKKLKISAKFKTKY